MESSPAQGFLVALCTCPDQEVAASLAVGLVESRLAACVNILAGVRSVYRWNGETRSDAEVLLVIKTQRAAYARMEDWLVTNHPYEVPEVIALSVDTGSEDYLAWLAEGTAQ